jgi:hemerythrin-like metal-binding protein
MDTATIRGSDDRPIDDDDRVGSAHGAVAVAAPAVAVAAPAVAIKWSEALATGDPLFDRTHRELIDLIAALEHSDADAMPAAVEAAIAHTQDHFRQETTLMQLHAFPPIHCHDTEHAQVLEVMIAVRARVAAGDHQYGRILAAALMQWLHVHVPTMDYVLAAWLRERGVHDSA